QGCLREFGPCVYRSSPKKKPTRTNRVGRIQLELSIRLAVEHSSSNTGDPLSSGPLSSVGGDEHWRQYSMKSRCFKSCSMPGNDGSQPQLRTASFVHSIGGSTGFLAMARQIDPLLHGSRNGSSTGWPTRMRSLLPLRQATTRWERLRQTANGS